MAVSVLVVRVEGRCELVLEAMAVLLPQDALVARQMGDEWWTRSLLGKRGHGPAAASSSCKCGVERASAQPKRLLTRRAGASATSSEGTGCEGAGGEAKIAPGTHRSSVALLVTSRARC